MKYLKILSSSILIGIGLGLLGGALLLITLVSVLMNRWGAIAAMVIPVIWGFSIGGGLASILLCFTGVFVGCLAAVVVVVWALLAAMIGILFYLGGAEIIGEKETAKAKYLNFLNHYKSWINR